MRLTISAIIDNLPAHMAPQMLGMPNELGLLRRPELYEGGERSFLSGHLYVLHAERVPVHAHAERGAAIICTGNSPRLRRLAAYCCVVTLDSADFFAAFNAVQHVYDAFDSWEDDLRRMLDEEGDVSRMLTRSEDVLGNALLAIDGDFKILGLSRLAQQNASLAAGESASLPLATFDQFLGQHALSTETSEPFVIDILGQRTLNCNLHKGSDYCGCVTLIYGQREERPSDKLVLKRLAHIIQQALEGLTSTRPNGPGSLRQAVEDLVKGLPLDQVSKAAIDSATEDRSFVCMRLKMSSRMATLPLGYVRNMVESTFPQSIVFEHHSNSVIAFIDLNRLPEGDPTAVIREAIEPFTSRMDMRAGLSDHIDNLMQARLYYLQANIALENGSIMALPERLHQFQDFALQDMIVSALGEIPLELWCPEGFRRLVEHDRVSSTSYIQTLRIYLACNMGATQAAAKLYVHRSTLLERLTRIRRELGLDLADPDTRLRIEMLLKALEIRDALMGSAAAE